MTLDAESCYRALGARDRRFDGLFFVGVATTGVYCRPVCPARTPARSHCVFFEYAVQAEQAGFRACFRCRPELAPGNAQVDARPRLLSAALARIEAGFLDTASVAELSAALGVSDRHLRRTFESELGVSPVEVAQSRRLAFAKRLICDSTLPLAEVAFAAGFSSVRRFNAALRERLGCAPSSLRREPARGNGDTCVLRLDYRPPFDWDALLDFVARRAIPGVESVRDRMYRRNVRLGRAVGTVAVERHASRSALIAHASASLADALPVLVARLRALFDLDAEPDRISGHLARDEQLAASVRRRPGLRVPGAFDGFEVAVRAVLGQQVSVDAATRRSGQLVERFGSRIGGRTHFPTPQELAQHQAEEISAMGLPRVRAQALVLLARACRDGQLDLVHGAPETTLERLLALPGIGPWTAHYIVMRALGWPDAFPAPDLGLRQALGGITARRAEQRARVWRPWRAYAAMHLWTDTNHEANP